LFVLSSERIMNFGSLFLRFSVGNNRESCTKYQPQVVIMEMEPTASRNDFWVECERYFGILDKGSNNRQLDYYYWLVERVLGRFCLLGHFSKTGGLRP